MFKSILNLNLQFSRRISILSGFLGRRQINKRSAVNGPYRWH
ncbi:hypothetical protein ALT1644_50041 [Alteromonas macleodii]